MRAGKFIGTLVLTVLLAGCGDRYPQESLKTELILNFSTPVDATLETKSMENGDSFHNLLVLLVRDNVILHKKTWSSDTYVADAVVRVPLVEVGAYEVYAYANYDETAWQQVTVGSTELIAETGDSFNPDRRLRGISATMPKPEEPAAPAEPAAPEKPEAPAAPAEPAKPAEPDACFYVYPNDSREAGAGTPATELVIEGKVKGTKRIERIALPSFGRNSSVNVEVTLGPEGTEAEFSKGKFY